MSKSQTLRALVTERLTAEYEEEMQSSTNENHRNLRHVEELKPTVLLSRPGTEVHLPSTSLGPGLDHGITKTEEIKEEPEDLLIISVPEFDAVCVKKEESSQLQIQPESREGTPGVSLGDEEDTDHSSDWERPIDWRDRKDLSPGNTSEPGTSSAVNDGNDSEADDAGSKKKRGQEFGKEKLKMNLKVLSGEKPYTCPMCVKEFPYISRLNSHMRIHTGEKLYSCSYCNKTFSRNCHLTNHMMTHTGDKPHSCSYCDKRFIQNSNLIRHMRTHTRKNPYSCSYCNKKFSQSTTLTNHIRTHTGEKPFRCSYCIKMYCSTSALRAHLKTHAGEKP